MPYKGTGRTYRYNLPAVQRLPPASDKQARPTGLLLPNFCCPPPVWPLPAPVWQPLIWPGLSTVICLTFACPPLPVCPPSVWLLRLPVSCLTFARLPPICYRLSTRLHGHFLFSRKLLCAPQAKMRSQRAARFISFHSPFGNGLAFSGDASAASPEILLPTDVPVGSAASVFPSFAVPKRILCNSSGEKLQKISAGRMPRAFAAPVRWERSE